jgi:DNA-binding MarR family transcriptional regulator
MTDPSTTRPGIAFLLSQLGGVSSREWTARLAREGLEPREVMLFRFVARAEGHSQREVASAIGLPASRIVGLVDRLEERGWIERRTSEQDRRTRSLHVTAAGRTLLERVAALSLEHEAALSRGLAESERLALGELLERIATTQGLIAGVHPGFADPRAVPGGGSMAGHASSDGGHGSPSAGRRSPPRGQRGRGSPAPRGQPSNRPSPSDASAGIDEDG